MMKKFLCFPALAGLLLLASCISQRLAQHNQAYDAAVQSAPGEAYFATSKEELQALWGKSQSYFCDSSDLRYHYLVLYYDTWLKRKYLYKVPSNTRFATIRADATSDTLRQRLKITLE